MMAIVQNDDVAAWYLKEVAGIDVVPPFVGLVVIDEEKIRGACLINDVADRNAEMSAVGEGCWTVPAVRHIARYLFVKLGCRRVTARTSTFNIAALDALRAMGFKYEGMLRDWYGDDEDCHVFGLTAREQRLVRIPQ